MNVGLKIFELIIKEERGLVMFVVSSDSKGCGGSPAVIYTVFIPSGF